MIGRRPAWLRGRGQVEWTTTVPNTEGDRAVDPTVVGTSLVMLVKRFGRPERSREACSLLDLSCAPARHALDVVSACLPNLLIPLQGGLYESAVAAAVRVARVICVALAIESQGVVKAGLHSRRAPGKQFTRCPWPVELRGLSPHPLDTARQLRIFATAAVCPGGADRLGLGQLELLECGDAEGGGWSDAGRNIYQQSRHLPIGMRGVII